MIGAKIIIATKNLEKGARAVQSIKKKNKEALIQLKVLDLSDFVNIRNFVEEIKKEYEQIDILINNAAIMTHPANKNFEENDLIFVTNYLGM